MRLLSDSIEDFIKALMEDEQDQQQAIELRRNELAEHFQCCAIPDQLCSGHALHARSWLCD